MVGEFLRNDEERWLHFDTKEQVRTAVFRRFKNFQIGVKRLINILNHLFRGSIQRKLVITFIIFIVIPLFLVNIYSNKIFELIIKDKINASISQTLSQLSYNIEGIINDIYTASNVISQDRQVLEVLSEKSYADYSGYLKDKITVKNVLDRAKSNIISLNVDMVVMDFYGDIYSTYLLESDKYNKDIFQKEWFSKIINQKGYSHWFKLEKEELGIISHDNTDTIAMGRLIRNNLSKNIGIIIISINEAELYKLIERSELTQKGKLFIMDPDGNIISHPDKRFIFKQMDVDGKEYYDEIFKKESGFYTISIQKVERLISYETIKFTKWKIISDIPSKWIFVEIDEIRRNVITISSVLFLGFIIMISLIVHKFVSPIKTLQILMNGVENGNLNIKFNLKSNDEIGLLANNFNSMVCNIKFLMEENAKKQHELFEEEKTKIMLKYRVLQSQINPHFLFNTFNNIKWLAVMNNDHSVADNISALCKLLEASIRNIDEEITIREEISYLMNYIQIMRLRYINKFDVTINIKEEILNYKILKLLLQPIVENSLLHGMADMKEQEEIQIVGSEKDNKLIIEIKDNGVGIQEDVIKRLLIEDLEKGPKRFNSLGIYSVNQRIKTNYGDQYGICIESQKYKGTKVIILLPIIQGVN